MARGDTLTPVQPEIVSPELVLVDPRLAVGARARLSDPDEAPTPLELQSSLDQAEPPLPVLGTDTASRAVEVVAGARRRLTELSEVEPPKRRGVRSSVLSRLRRRSGQP